MRHTFRYFRTKKGRQLLITVILVFTSVFISLYRDELKPVTSSSVVSGTYRVTDVYDGDTIEVDMNGKTETVRFIGIDTPETHDPRKPVQCFGKSASDFTKSQVAGKLVRLEADSLSTNRDRYDRLLRYVYVEDTLVNAEIVKQGYGFANTGFPFTKMEEFISYQKQAEEEKRGLWGGCTVRELDNGQRQTNDTD